MIERKRCLKYFFKQTDIYKMSTDEIGLAIIQIRSGKNIVAQSELAANTDNTRNQVNDAVMNDLELLNNEETISNEGW